jgi:hypothetical protein
MRQTCTFHCRRCDRHFHSLKAFDAHREFTDPAAKDWASRVCLNPAVDEMKPALEAWTRSGVCQIQYGRDDEVVGVTVWTERGARERAEALSALPRVTGR